MNQTELKARVRQALLAEQYRETGKLLFPVSVSNRHVHLDAARPKGQRVRRAAR